MKSYAVVAATRKDLCEIVFDFTYFSAIIQLMALLDCLRGRDENGKQSDEFGQPKVLY